MEQKYLLRKVFAGMFFVLCILIISGVVFILGVEKGLTEPKFEMTVYFRKVGGLTAGAPVRVSGVNVGTVANIDFLDKEVNGRGVEVRLSIYEKYKKQLHKASRVSIITEGVLGDKMIEVTPQPDIYIKELSRPIIGDDPLDIQSLAETFGEAAVALLETSKVINAMTVDLRAISITTKRLLNRIEQRIIDGTLFKVF